MKFWAVVNGDPVICWVEEAVLLSFLHDPADEEKNVRALFVENREQIRAMARRTILGQRLADSNSTVVIRADSSHPTDPV